MTNQEMKKRLQEVANLTTATPEQVQLMFVLYRELFDNKANLCASCPSSVRMVQKNLKHFLENDF